MKKYLISLILLSVSTAMFLPWSEVKPTEALLETSYFGKIKQMWDDFMKTFKTVSINSYTIFAENAMAMLNHNFIFATNSSSFEMGINEFAAMTETEFAKRLGLRKIVTPKTINTIPRLTYRGLARSTVLPNQIDLRKEGYVTKIKNQGSCGSCWAFSAVGALEGAWKRAHGELLSLSEQQLVDCSSKFGNFACDGGLMDDAFEYIKSAGGIESEESYPYVSGITGSPKNRCLFKKEMAVANLTAIFDVPMKNEKLLMEAVAYIGPVSIAINAGLRSFMMYKKGIYDDKHCIGEPDDLNHGVLLVGYGIENNIPFWIVKNSWGTNWGENGFIRIKRENNLCGVTTLASYPIV